jgi:hypothetical protein
LTGKNNDQLRQDNNGGGGATKNHEKHLRLRPENTHTKTKKQLYIKSKVLIHPGKRYIEGSFQSG